MEMDLSSKVSPAIALNFQTIASDTTTVGEIVDTKGFESVDIAIASGAIAAGDLAIIIEDGDDAALADAAAVSSELIIGSLPSFAATDDNVVKHFGCISKKRYIRISAVSTNSTTSTEVCAIATLGDAKSAPTLSTAVPS